MQTSENFGEQTQNFLAHPSALSQNHQSFSHRPHRQTPPNLKVPANLFPCDLKPLPNDDCEVIASFFKSDICQQSEPMIREPAGNERSVSYSNPRVEEMSMNHDMRNEIANSQQHQVDEIQLDCQAPDIKMDEQESHEDRRRFENIDEMEGGQVQDGVDIKESAQ